MGGNYSRFSVPGTMSAMKREKAVNASSTMSSVLFVLHSEVSISHERNGTNPRLSQLWQVFYVRRSIFHVRN